MKEQCLKCGNWVEGKKVATFARKMTRGAVKKGSAVATGMAIGSIIPGAGTIIGGALGLAASALMEDTVNDAADLVEELAFDETEYEFTCPKCRRIWRKKQRFKNMSYINNQVYSPQLGTSYSNEKKTAILSLILGLKAAKEKAEKKEVMYSTRLMIQKFNPNFSEDEQEYLEEVKMCLEGDNQISPRERRLLDRLRTKLNITEERQKELEESLKTPQLTEEEQEYLEEYKLCFEEDGEISSKERRLLDRLRDKLGISVERAKELENNYK